MHYVARSEKAHRGIRLVSGMRPTAEKYPYPDKPFVMTNKRWLKSANETTHGNPDWFDVEVVRQRALVEKYAPAMELLGWMYQEGRGLNKDLRKAYNMYERAKLAGETKVRGDTEKIYDRLTQSEQLVANILLQEDIQRIKPDAGIAHKRLKRVNFQVMEQREPKSLRNKGRGFLDFIN